MTKQLTLPTPRTWGGRRKGAGRKPSGRPCVPHLPRPPHAARIPVHVTLRAHCDLPSLRGRALFAAFEGALGKSSTENFRVLHFSVQRDHVHLIVEADDRRFLSRGIQGLAIRVAKAVNADLNRRGPVWGDRYHARPLRTPREVRNAIAYVLLNWRKHVADARADRVDRCSSGKWFAGWRDGVRVAEGLPSVVAPRTWLASVGWRRHGLLRLDEAIGRV